MSWSIQLYETLTGQNPAEDFIKSLQPNTIAKLRNQINLLSEFGPKLTMPHAKPLGDGLYELRVRGKEEIRTIYVYQKGKTIIILHGFKKKTMAISRRDLKIALQRKKEVDNL